MEEKKWISVEACSGNKEAFKTGSHAHAKLGEVEVIVLIYTIVHAFFAGSEIGLCWNHSPIYHTVGPPIAWRGGEWSNKACNVVMVKIWVGRLDCLRLDLTTAGVLGLKSRLSYCEICAATCFRLRGDNLNENPPFYHAYERAKGWSTNSRGATGFWGIWLGAR